jgi:RHS repeat-associated protein
MDGGAAVYGYDGEGRRMKKTVGSETTYYFYGATGLLCEFTTTNTGATQAASTDRATYRTSDKLGSAVLIVNASGTVIENNRTLPYGEAWLPEVASTNEKKFASYQRDGESGLDYAFNRYYANTSGRFVSADRGSPVGFVPQTLNRYVYTANDPINHSDPDGNELQCSSRWDR